MSDDYDDDNENEPQVPADLRKAYEKQKKLLADAIEARDKLAVKDRERTVGDLIKDKNLDPRVVGLIPPNADPAEWLTTYGDLFGAPKVEPEPPTGPPADVTDELQRQQGLEAPGGDIQDGDLLQKVQNASYEELIQLVTDAQPKKF